MNIFISWSGERSKRVAELLESWLQCVIQSIDPWLSTRDIDSGALWFSEIGDQLSNTTIGIICLTKENREKPWILFEAGALAKGLSTNRICPLLIDLNTSEISNPLAQFNHTLPERESMFKMMQTINRNMTEKKLTERVLEKVFNTYWPQFESDFKTILENTVDTKIEIKEQKSNQMAELLDLVRSVDKRLRRLEKEENLLNNHTYLAHRESKSLRTSDLIDEVRQWQKKGMPIQEIISRVESSYPPAYVKEITRLLINEMPL